MIKCNNVTFRYRKESAPALDDVSFEITNGESLCIMGANGSGKSTLARVLAGLIKPDQGDVTVNGTPPSDEANSATTGILFQNPDNQMVAMMVDKEVAFALENKAVPVVQMETVVSDTLEKYRISPLRSRLTSELSGGEKQRVALAAATVYRPTVLILDEPDSFLDADGRIILKEELKAIRQSAEEMIEIRVTQFPEVALKAPRLIVMEKGKVVADGPPDTIFVDSDFCHRTCLRYDPANHTRLKFPAVLKNKPDVNNVRPGRIKLKSVTFGYGHREPVLKDLDFDLQAGETVGLVGPTGSGKSSLGLLLCSLMKPESGEVAFLDESGKLIGKTGQPGWVSGVLQLPERQFFLSTCSSEVAFGPENLGSPISDAEIRGYFDLVGLGPDAFAERDPFSLSVGEKRRLAFAAVLSMSPAFVIFDEPTASLDQEGLGRFIAMSRLLKQRGMGQVIISHDGEVIEALADRVVYLKGDRTSENLATGDLFKLDEYRHVVTGKGSL